MNFSVLKYDICCIPSLHWRWWLDNRKGIQLVRNLLFRNALLVDPAQRGVVPQRRPIQQQLSACIVCCWPLSALVFLLCSLPRKTTPIVWTRATTRTTRRRQSRKYAVALAGADVVEIAEEVAESRTRSSRCCSAESTGWNTPSAALCRRSTLCWSNWKQWSRQRQDAVKRLGIYWTVLLRSAIVYFVFLFVIIIISATSQYYVRRCDLLLPIE